MTIRWNPEALDEVFALPAQVVDRHIRLAGSAQLKVLLWLARAGRGTFDADACAAAIGLSAADCTDALQYWVETGVLSRGGEKAYPAAKAPQKAAQPKAAASVPAAAAVPAAVPAARPRAVKPQMTEVIARQKRSPEFAYLLDTTSARLGRPISHGDMETLLYLYDTAGLPAEVILMVVAYAVTSGKTNMRYVEKVALDWVDKGITTMEAAEERLCHLERSRRAWERVHTLLDLSIQNPTAAQLNTAEKWIFEWNMPDELIAQAFAQCREKTGGFQCNYMNKILEHWHTDGVDTLEKAQTAGRGKKAAKGESSLDLEAYERQVESFVPVFRKA